MLLVIPLLTLVVEFAFGVGVVVLATCDNFRRDPRWAMLAHDDNSKIYKDSYMMIDVHKPAKKTYQLTHTSP